MALQSLTINNWQTGISESPYFGFEDMVNLDIHSRRGAIRLDWSLAKEFTAPTGGGGAQIQFLTINPDDDKIYSVQSGTNAFYARSTIGGWSTSSSFSNDIVGMAIWRDTAIAFYGDAGDLKASYVGTLSGTPSLTDTWETITTGATGSDIAPVWVAQDDAVYVGQRNYVSRILEKAGSTFDPTSSATYTIDDQALDLPNKSNVVSLTEIGANLLIGTNIRNSSSANARIFPWNTTSASFNLPIIPGLKSIDAMRTINNRVFALGGNTGQLLITNTVNTQKVRDFSNQVDLDTKFGNSVTFEGHYAMATLGGDLYIGFGAANSSTQAGVWKYSNNAWTRQLISTGNDGTDGNVTIYAIEGYSELPERIVVSWRDQNEANQYGVDSTSTTARYTSGHAISQFYQLGDYDKKTQFEKIYINLVRPLASGDSVKVAYRTNTRDSFTEIADFNFTSHGAVSEIVLPSKLPALSSVQFKVTLECGGSTNTPELLSITFS